jgi:hypothetical protein
MLYYEKAGPDLSLSDDDLAEGLIAALEKA